MTLKKAINLSLIIWEYLAEHPEIKNKENLPENIFKKIHHLFGYCPLCELFLFKEIPCSDCPLGNCGDNSLFTKWQDSKTKKDRKIYAYEIVNAIKLKSGGLNI
jgi:hypothetical protein